MADTRPVGVFDSGVGGLSALREIRRLLPKENLVYFGDTARIPYGTRSDDTIIKYSLEDMRFLLSKDVKAVVVACGTVSSIALGLLRETFEVPIIGVVEPAARRAAELTANGKIGVFGTSATIKSSSYEREIKKIAPKFSVTQRACPLLVPLIENGYIGPDSLITRLALREYLEPIRSSGSDVLILGCTHYPLIRELIEDEWGLGKTVDTGLEAAEEIKRLLRENDIENEWGGSTSLFSSDSAEAFGSQARLFLDEALCREASVEGSIRIEDFR